MKIGEKFLEAAQGVCFLGLIVAILHPQTVKRERELKAGPPQDCSFLFADDLRTHKRACFNWNPETAQWERVWGELSAEEALFVYMESINFERGYRARQERLLRARTLRNQALWVHAR